MMQWLRSVPFAHLSIGSFIVTSISAWRITIAINANNQAWVDKYSTLFLVSLVVAMVSLIGALRDWSKNNEKSNKA